MIAVVYPQFYGVGGIARYLDSFLSNLPADHPPVYLVTGDEHQVTRSYPGVEIIHIPFSSSRFNLFIWGFRVRKLLIRLHDEGKIQWVNLHFPPLIPGLFLPRHIPVVLTAHTTYLGMSGQFYEIRHFESQWSATSLSIKSWMERRIFDLTNKVITLTEQGRQEVLAYGFKGSVAVIPNGADVKLYTPDKTVHKDIDVLFCGRIEFRKGSRAMVELCRLLIAKKPDIQIAIVGYGDDDAWVIDALATNGRNVLMTGKVAFSETIGYYNRSRVYVSTSYYEGLPGTCLEAMAMQLPAVVWEFLFYRGLVVDGQTGSLVAPNDFVGMADKVLGLLSNPQLAAEMGRNGRALLESDYNWEKLTQNVLDVFSNAGYKMNRPIRVMLMGLRGFPEVQGGVETHAEYLCPLLVEMGCDVTVLVRSPYQHAKIGPEWKGVKFICLWAPKSKAVEAFLHSFLGLLYAAFKRPDILHIQAIGPAIMTLPARLLGLRVVVTHHGPDYHRHKWGRIARTVLQLGERWGMRWSNGRIVISKVIADLIRDKHDADSVLIPNGVVLPMLPDSVGALETFDLTLGRYVLLVSRLVPEKRHLDLIAAFKQANLHDWKLVLMGGADHPDAYQCEVTKKAAEAGVVMTGFLRGLALQELYAHAGLFVLPSSHEGLPIALLEALSFGLPVLASDIPANLEVGLSAKHYFPLGEIEALADRIILLSSVSQTMVERNRIRAWVTERYDWRDIAEKTLGLYISCLDKNQR